MASAPERTTNVTDNRDGALQAWRTGLAEEVAFWRAWITSEGLDWKDDYASRLDPHRELRVDLRALVALSDERTPRILDVGAGPLSVLGCHWPGREMELVPVDALAEVYHTMLADRGVVPPVPTIPCETERLAEQFGEGSFDLAYARNTLDHSYDPVAAIRAMLHVVADNACVVIEHRENEGANAGYCGLHQWDFEVQPEDLLVRRVGMASRISEHTADLGVIEYIRFVDDEWFLCVLRKVTTNSQRDR